MAIVNINANLKSFGKRAQTELQMASFSSWAKHRLYIWHLCLNEYAEWSGAEHRQDNANELI